NRPISTMGQEHTLLLLCVHGTRHFWGNLKWVCDIAQAVSAFSEIDWARTLARADKLGCRRMLLIGMVLARDVCGVDLPASIERSLGAPEAMNGHCRDIQLRLFDGSEPPVNLARTLTFLRSRERLCDRMLIALRFVWPELKPNERDRALIRLPHCMRAL